MVINEKLNSEFTELQKRVSQQTTPEPSLANSSVNIEKTVLEKKITSLMKENESLKIQIKQNQQVKDLQSDQAIKVANQEINDLKAEVTMLKKEVQMNKQNQMQTLHHPSDYLVKGLEQKLSFEIREKESLKNSLKAAQQEIQELRSKSYGTKTLEFKAFNLESELAAVKKTLHDKTEEIYNLKGQILENNKFKYELDLKKQELEKTKTELKAKIVEIGDLTSRIKTLNVNGVQNKELMKRYFLARTAAQMFSNRNANLSAQLDQMARMIHTDDILDTEIQVRKLLDERDMLMSQNQRMKAPLENLTKNVDIMKEQVEGKLEEINSLCRSYVSEDRFNQKTPDLKSSREFNFGELSTTSRTGNLSSPAKSDLIRFLDDKASELKGYESNFRDFERFKENVSQMESELKQVQNRLETIEDNETLES